MPQVINTNIPSLNAQRNLNTSQTALSTALQRLSSGLRINSAKDDAAGLAIAERFTSQIRGLNQAVRNSNDAISLSQTAEGALGSLGELLQRIRELAVQSANDTNSTTDRTALQQEVSQLQQEVNRIAQNTQFNGRNLLDGTFAAQSFQVGANSFQTISVSLSNAQSNVIGNYYVRTAGTSNNAAAADTALGSFDPFTSQTFTINGTSSTTAAITSTAGTGSASGYTVAAAVNAVTSTTGVSAKAITAATLGSISTAGTVTFDLYGSNTTAVAISATIASTGDLSALNDAINQASAQTGITSSVSGGTLTLKSEQGYNIAIGNFDHTTAGATASFRGRNAFTDAVAGAAVTLTDAASDSSGVGATVQFSSNKSFSVSSTATTVVTAATSATLAAVSSASITNAVNASNAIDTLDAALATINEQRASLGAIQNRLQNTVANLQNNSENLSAARSRIQDADFAEETAKLTRAQILQQAGVAILSQANALPNNVLALLRQ